MAGERESVTAVHAALARLPRGRWVLAVSGGRDSMVLLDAMASARAEEIAAVATMDHGTGAAARRACELVEREAAQRGLPVVIGAAPRDLPFTEAHWRAARHAFLQGWAREFDASVVTAHTRDDQVETVVLRLLRASGPRGLAAMLASGVRPFLTLTRSTVAKYASVRGIPVVEDPSNQTLTFQRNRVRHEILPALERSAPGFGAWCWSLSERAAAWRLGLERFVETLDPSRPEPTTLVIAASPLLGLTAPEWEVLWPALAARVGVVMDRRGIVRAAAWAPRATPGSAIPLSGHARLERTGSTFIVRGTT